MALVEQAQAAIDFIVTLLDGVFDGVRHYLVRIIANDANAQCIAALSLAAF
jgi:hypothetical protein